MALPSSLVLELRSDTGADVNGGSFDPAAAIPGTDYTYPTSSPITYTDLVIQATATNVSSAARAFVAADVGNTINVTGGTGFTVGRYSVRSVAAGIATLDAAVGTAASTGGAGTLGGAWGTYDAMMTYLATLSSNQAAGWTIWVRAASGYTTTTTSNTHNCAGTAALRINYRGYGTVRGDTGVPVITTNGGSWAFMIGAYWTVRQMKIVSGTSTSGPGFRIYGDNTRVEDCFVSGLTGGPGFLCDLGAQALFTRCYATTCQTGFTVNGYGRSLNNCVAETCGTGFSLVGQSNTCLDMTYLTAINSTGDGFQMTASVAFWYCIATGSGANGFNYTSGAGSDLLRMLNCYAGQSAQYGFKSSTPAIPNAQRLIGCGFYSNTSGHTNLTPALPAGNVSLTAAPFVNPSASDYRLNNAAGGGALLRGAGTPVTVGPSWLSPWNAVTSATDIGVYQHATPALGLTVTGTPPVLVWDADPRSTKYDVLGFLGAAYTVLIANTTATTYTDSSGAGYTSYSVVGVP